MEENDLIADVNEQNEVTPPQDISFEQPIAPEGPVESSSMPEEPAGQTPEDYIDLSYYNDALEDNKKEIDDHIDSVRLTDETGESIPDYMAEYESLIEGTGTSLDGKDINDVAVEQKKSPKEIWDTVDVLKSIFEGGRAFIASTFEFGGEAAVKAFELTPPGMAMVAAEKYFNIPKGDYKVEPFGKPEAAESESYAGSIAGNLTQLGLGVRSIPIKAGAGLLNLAKSPLGKTFIKGMVQDLRIGMAEGIGTSGLQKNMSEQIKDWFGMTPTEFLTKNPDDPELLKRFKNGADATLVSFMLTPFFKMAGKVFKHRNLAEKVIEQSEKEGKKLAKQAVKDGVGKTVAEYTEEAIENRIKAFKDSELVDILKKAEKDQLIPKQNLSKANRDVLENTAVQVVKQRRAGLQAAETARSSIEQFTYGELNREQFNQKIIDAAEKLLVKPTVAAKESGSAAGTVGKVLSSSEQYVYANKALTFIKENADKMDTMQLAELLMGMENPRAVRAFQDVAGNLAKNGQLNTLVDKFTFVVQNIRLLSGASRLKDAVSTSGHLALQVGDAFTSAAYGYAKRGVIKGVNAMRQIAGKEALTTFKSEADVVRFSEGMDMLHGMFSLIGESISYGTKKTVAKAKGLKFEAENPFKKAIRQSVDASQTRMYLTRQDKMNLVADTGPFKRFINKVFNHNGIWLAEKIDDINQAIAYRAHLEREVGIVARTKAAQNGWTKEQTQEFARDYLLKAKSFDYDINKVYDFANALTEEGRIYATVKRSANKASETTFRGPLKEGSLEQDIYDLMNDHAVIKQAARLVFPFQKTGLKIGFDEYLRKRSGWASLPYLTGELKKGGRAADEAMGRVINGFALQAYAWYQYKQGKMTANVPDNLGERDLLESTGWMAHSRFDGEYYTSYADDAGPLGPMIQGTLDIIDKIDRISEYVEDKDEEDFSDYISMLPSYFAESGTASTVVGAYLSYVEQGDIAGGRAFLKSLATLAPDIGRELTEWNTFEQQANSELMTLARKMGVASLIDGTKDKLDLFGEPMYRKTANIKSLGSKRSKYVPNEVAETMLHYKAFVTKPRRNVTKDGRSIQLSPDEVYQWQENMGKLNTFSEMQDFIHSPEFERLPEEKENMYGKAQGNRTKALKSMYNDFKSKALDMLIEENEDVREKLRKAGERNQEPQISVRYDKMFSVK